MRSLFCRGWFPGLLLGFSSILLVGCTAVAAEIPILNAGAATPVSVAESAVPTPTPVTPAPSTAQPEATRIARSPTTGSPAAASGAATADQVRIQNSSEHQDLVGRYQVVGEIANKSDSTIYDPAVMVRFLSADGSLAGVQTTDALVRMLAPGEKGPFVILATPPKGWAKVSLSLTYDPSASMSTSHEFRFSEQKQYTGGAVNYSASRVNVATDDRFYVGKVTNTSPHALHFTTVVFTGYDANGKVVRTAGTFVGKSGELASGATAPYQFELSASDAKAIASIAVIAEGQGN